MLIPVVYQLCTTAQGFDVAHVKCYITIYIAASDLSHVISDYYTYLEGHMDADSVSHMMHCEHLITNDDYDVITTAPNDTKMNCLLLHYVKLMDIKELFKFCVILKSIETLQSIGESLELCKLWSHIH